jgi:cell division FtsZ-interacting protein ZapD
MKLPNVKSFINNLTSSNNGTNEIIEKLMRNIGSSTQKISKNGLFKKKSKMQRIFFKIDFFIVTQLNNLVQQIGTINDSDKNRERLYAIHFINYLI